MRLTCAGGRVSNGAAWGWLILAAVDDIIRIGVVVVLGFIVLSMGSALFHLSSKKGDGQKMLRALTVRISLSVVLFILLMLGWYLGVLHPHELLPTPPR